MSWCLGGEIYSAAPLKSFIFSYDYSYHTCKSWATNFLLTESSFGRRNWKHCGKELFGFGEKGKESKSFKVLNSTGRCQIEGAEHKFPVRLKYGNARPDKHIKIHRKHIKEGITWYALEDIQSMPNGYVAVIVLWQLLSRSSPRRKNVRLRP